MHKECFSLIFCHTLKVFERLWVLWLFNLWAELGAPVDGQSVQTCRDRSHSQPYLSTHPPISLSYNISSPHPILLLLPCLPTLSIHPTMFCPGAASAGQDPAIIEHVQGSASLSSAWHLRPGTYWLPFPSRWLEPELKTGLTITAQRKNQPSLLRHSSHPESSRSLLAHSCRRPLSLVAAASDCHQ